MRSLRASQAQPYSFERIVGDAPALAAVKALLKKVATSPASTVLLTGESGTGKDLAAKVIHYNSSRASKPFMNITCSALPESELFGHEREDIQAGGRIGRHPRGGARHLGDQS